MMKLVTLLKGLALATAAISSLDAIAYNDDKDKELCRQPKIQEFTLPEYKEPDKKEVPPEADFSFVVSGWANPKKFKINGKGQDIPFTVQSSDTFHKVKAKLPPEFTGKAVRINARIPAVLGCYSTIGWLIKVADKADVADAQKPAETAAPAANSKELETGQNGAPPSETKSPQNNAPVADNPPTAPADSKAVAP